MLKNKTIISIAIVVAIIIVIGVFGYFILNNSKMGSIIASEESKTMELYNNLKNEGSYKFLAELNDENKIMYIKKDEKAYIEETFDGETSKFIIKDGNTYLLQDDEEQYYTYSNNESDLKLIENELNQIEGLEATLGREKVNNKSYDYEQYEFVTAFAMLDWTKREQEGIKTRFYFEENNLMYIKTLIGDTEELLKVNISKDNINDDLFEIPSDYQEM